jgi:enamine deaminase RidA (YjgF/YER057c/UK114 family)
MARKPIRRELVEIDYDRKRDKCDDCDDITCKFPLVVRQNPPGKPPIIPPPFPLIAYSYATIDTGCNVLYVGGLQGFLPNGELAPTVKQRVELAYASIFAVANFYGATPLDILSLEIWVNPDSPVAIKDFPTLTSAERFAAIRDIANAIQAPIYGDIAPTRSILGVTQIVLEDVIEIKPIFKLRASQPICKKKPKYFKAIKRLPFKTNYPNGC